MLKKILPFEKLVYQSTLTKEELLDKLQNEINPGSQAYSGKIIGDKFEIKRTIGYRNSFLPLIEGEIKPGLSGAKINVEMRLVQTVKIFMILWFSGVTFACLATLFAFLFGRAEVSILFIPFSMLLFGIAMVSIGFKAESRKDLEVILNAKLIE